VLQRLREALPIGVGAAAQSRLLMAIRSYVDSKCTPEDFAETIHQLVDDFQVLIC
jgi:hypothetical protein